MGTLVMEAATRGFGAVCPFQRAPVFRPPLTAYRINPLLAHQGGNDFGWVRG